MLKLAQQPSLEKYCDNPWLAAILVPQDSQDAAGLLLDFQRHLQIFPQLKDIAITPLGESRYRIWSRVKAGIFQFRFTTLWEYQAKEHLASFDLDPEEKNDFEQYKGFWKFLPQPDGKTLILYSIRTKTPDNPLAFLEEQASRKEMPKTLEEFKKALSRNTGT